jgi:general secretion pathway protein D
MLLLLGGFLLWLPTRAEGQLAISPIANTNVPINRLLHIQVSVTPSNILSSQLNFSLTSVPSNTEATNASITLNGGDFTWLPTQTQTVTFTVNVTNLGTTFQASTSFTVTVTNNTVVTGAPYLALPLTLTNITSGMTLTFTAFATNTDSSANALTFSLDTNSVAAGATITNTTPTNGLFQWTPATAQAGFVYEMRVIVTELSTPPVSTTQAFTVNVLLTNNCSQYSQFLATVAAGGYVPLTNCPTLVLSNTITIATNVFLDAVSGSVTIAGNNALRLFTVLPGASLTLNGVTLQGGSSDRGGAIYNGGTVVLSNCVVAGNSAVGGSGSNGVDGDNDANYGKDGTDATPGLQGVGGAILNLGSLTANSCQFTNNRATGGNGGSGGSGGSGSYRGGNGRHGGDGALAFGGAIYSAGSLLSLNHCFFSGNSATGGSGGSGGTNGTGAFPGYMGTGGAGAEGSGGAIYCANSATMLNCTNINNTAQGGNSAPSGEAGGGYGVKGAPGGNSFGGGVCLLGGGQLISCGFTSDTVTGGNGGDGGSGKYIGGNGGNGGDGVGGCLYNFGGATVVNCAFSGCGAVGGVNGVAGGGPFSGRNGQPGSSSTNASSTITTTNVVFATGLPAGVPPAVLGPNSNLTPENSLGAPTGGPNSAQPQAGPPINSQGAANVTAPPGSNPASANTAPNAAPAINLPGGPAGLPAAGTDRPAGSRKPFVPVAAAAPTNSATIVTPVPATTSSSLEEPLPQGMIDFRSADLTQVLDIYSMMVNRTILRPATLPAPTITLTTRGQLTMGEGIQALQAVLALNGIVMVNVGDKFVKAMPEAQGGAAGGRFDTNSAALLPDMGQFVTHVVQLKYTKPSEMVAVLTPFVKIPNAVLPIEASQMLVLRDYTENVKRMLELIKEIDVAIPSEFVSEVIPIKYAVAGDIASALNSLSSGGGGAASPGGGGTTSKRGTRTSGMNRTGTTGGYPGQMPGMGTQPGAVGTTPGGQPGSSFSDRLRNIISRASATGEIQVIGQTKIISDERTNSLLIYAGKDDMKIIKDIVSKLDVVLAQVLIESVIISVTLNDSHDLGFSYLMHPQNSGRLTGVGALNNNNMLQPGNFALAGATNAAGGIPQGFSYLMSWGQDLDVTVTAAQANSHAKILQTPYIQTSHNEPATLFVGESRPYPTSSYYGGGAYGGYSSIQQLQIGVTLEVTPLVNPDGLVVMDIHQKIDSFEGNVTIQNVGDVPVTSSKEASAKVSVRDHDTIILGGLIETDKNKSASGIPLLMDIPLLGSLFRASHDDGKRTELIVLIRPTVLPTPEIAALTATAQKNKMPGVRETEKELRDDEKQRLKQADQADKVIRFQPVEKP